MTGTGSTQSVKRSETQSGDDEESISARKLGGFLVG